MKKIMSPSMLFQFLREEGVGEVYISPSPAQPIQSSQNEWAELKAQAHQCTRCHELASTRKNVVFGSGAIPADLMFVGEAPGFDEDVQGLPFVGKAGQLLTKIIEAIQLKRENVYIANVLKCRPPANRQPLPDEIANCRPYLMKQIEFIKPRVICALGSFAAQTLLQTTEPISQLRGRFCSLGNIRVRCTYHPAYLLRNPSEKGKVWEDMKAIRKELNEVQGAR